MTTEPLRDATVRECATDHNSRLEGGTEAFDEWLAGVRADAMDGATQAVADAHRELATVKQQRSDNLRAIAARDAIIAAAVELTHRGGIYEGTRWVTPAARIRELLLGVSA